MNFAPAVAHALQKDLDVIGAFPMVFHMRPEVVEIFVSSLVDKLNAKILKLLEEGGEPFVAENNPEGMANYLLQNGLRLPRQMLLDMCKTIVKTTRYSIEWIAPVPHSNGDMWYVRMFVDMKDTPLS